MRKSDNPWRGLASYQDPLETKFQYDFCGRDEEIIDLVDLIDNNLFVTLYGRTGVGKTSLLNAGVFPVLRGRGYLPVYVRLAQKSMGKSYAETIVGQISKVLKERNCESKSKTLQEYNANEITFLWNYFHTTTFTDSNGSKIYPVVVLDQFEEIFFSKKEDAVLLLRQIYALIADDLVVPICDAYHNETNYRFVASIREDNLFYLEDFIDELSLNLFKSNRYRLRPFSKENARLAILKPGSKYLDKDNVNDIVSKIVELSKEKDGSISSLILSLICYLMFQKAEKYCERESGIRITLELVPSTSRDADKILHDYYVANTTRKQRKIIETHLLTKEGHRKASSVQISEVNNLLYGDNRLLQKVETGSGTKIEIIHDRLAEIVHLNKVMYRNKGLKGLVFVLVSLIVVFLIIILVQFNGNKELEITTNKNWRSFSVFLKEDSSVTDNDFWKATLLVIKDKGNLKDTLIYNVNKTYCGVNPITEIKDTLNSVRMVLEFSNKELYKTIDISYPSSYLIDHPSVILTVGKFIRPTITYTSTAVVNVDGMECPIENAIVIMADQITRTDSTGRFSFSMQDSLSQADNLYILWGKSQLFKSESLMLVDGNLQEKFVISPLDSLSWFKQECLEVDTLHSEDWDYVIPMRRNLRDFNILFSSGTKDFIQFYGRTNGYTSEHKFLIRGYYYFSDEYRKLPDDKKYYSYHIFTGWMSTENLRKKDSPKYKSFEIESHDLVGNKQRINGHYLKNGKIAGQISRFGKIYAVFGGYKDDGGY